MQMTAQRVVREKSRTASCRCFFKRKNNMSYTDIDICSKALLKLGAESITSFSEGTAEAEISASLYPLAKDGLLSSYPWSFAVAQARLPRLAENPLADYGNAYLLPTDFLRVISAGSGNQGRGINYRIFENKLHTDMPEVNLTYIRQVKESEFPPFFVEALVAKLSAEICIPLTENNQRAEALLRQSEEVIRKARLTDSQQATPKGIEGFVLLESRK